MLPKVLIVEDDDIIREIYALKFALEGFAVDSAENGQVGLQKVNEFEPEVILLDMMMPVMSGLDFMQALKNTRDTLPDVIVFSNVSVPKQVDAVMRLGAKDYWVKSDYTPDTIATKVAEHWRAHGAGAAQS
jgi:DNA-binding response OmpR family regulator